jgi:ABC-type multidrug transport system ATPase subunit
MIVVSHLSKRFGRLLAVQDLSFTVEAGQAVALWGANGAGKTTALRCLLNLLPFEGQITIDGLDVRRQGKAARGLIGFVPQDLTFHDDMTTAETIIFYARLKKVPSGHDFTPLLDRLELTPHLKKLVSELSGGLKQRLALALALLTDPPVLVLDEPTANLDIRAREDFLDLLLQLKRSGKALVFSSHRLEEVTTLADRVLLLEGGKLAIDAPPQQLQQHLGWKTVLHIYMPDSGIEPALVTLTEQGLLASRNGRGVRVQVAAGEKGRILNLLHQAGILIEDFAIE